MGSHRSAANRMLVSLLLPVLVVVVAQAQDSPAVPVPDVQAGDAPAPVTDLSQVRRERLRNLFARRREQRIKPGDGGQEERKSVRTRIVRPQIRKEEPEKEERIVTSVSVSSSVSTSSKISKRVRPGAATTTNKPENIMAESPSKTSRKRFRLIKNPGVNQDELLEKLLANIDLKNDIVTEPKRTRRPSRFRPSLNRSQLRKKAEFALKPKLRNSRIRIRKPNTTTEKTIATTVQKQEQEVEASTSAVVASKQSNEETVTEQHTTIVTERYEEVTEAAKAEVLEEEQNDEINEIIDEITTEKQKIPTTKRVETTRKVDRANFFRRNSPRRFGFGRRPVSTTSAPKPKPAVNTIDDAVTAINLPKETPNLKFGSFPVINRLNTPIAKDVQQPLTNKPKPIIIQAPSLPQSISNEIAPAFNMVLSESQPKLKLNNRKNQNKFISPNLIVQPAFLKPVQHKQPSQIPETQRSIPQPRRPVRVQTNSIQPEKDALEAEKQQPVNIIVRDPVFPTFELPDFFKVPFAAFKVEASSPPSKVGTPAQNQAGALFSSIGRPQGTVQGHPRATNLNILTGSYSVGW